MGENRSRRRGTRVCRACKRRKRLTAFYRRIAPPDGLDPWCRTCRRDYLRRWIALHREEYNAKHRAYYQRRGDELRTYNREYQRRRRALLRAGKWKPRSYSWSVPRPSR